MQARIPVLILLSFLAQACVSTTAPQPGAVVTAPEPAEIGELRELLEADLETMARREAWRDAGRSVDEILGKQNQRRARRSAALRNLVIPVEGVSAYDLENNFGAPRDGGKRSHRGIDIFAPRGTRAVAVTDAVITYIGEQTLGGKCVWIRADDGSMFYYAHLDRWFPGIHEGMRVRKGQTLGFVGTTGNAVNTPPHLHFQVVSRSETLNPYEVLLRAVTGYSRPVLSGGFGRVVADD